HELINSGRKDYENFDRLDELSTVKQVTADHPPTFLAVGDADQLESQTRELEKILLSKKVSVSRVYWKDRSLQHDYMYDLSTKEGRYTYEKLIEFLQDNS
ncbi:MAG: alpha/beta hydrolase, partial [Bacteroidota bacterium]